MAYSIIIPSKNIDNLRACVGALRAAGETGRVIVLDDGLPLCWDGPPDQTAWHPMRVVAGAEPFCFARNVNIGIRVAGGDDVVLLNDDVLLVTDHGFSKMADVSECHQHVGVWSASVIGKSVNPVHHGGPRYGALIAYRSVKTMVPFVAVYIRRAVIDSVGLLDERFCGSVYQGRDPMADESGTVEVYGGEDDDYCYRVRHAGMKIAVSHSCTVEHGSLPSTFRPDGKPRSIAGARARFYEIHGFTMGSR